MRDSKRQIIIFLIAIFAIALCAVCVSACGAGNKPKTYTVSFIVDGEEYFSGKEQWDKSFVFPDEPDKNGYKFSGWYDGEDKITEIKQGYKDKVTLTAIWEIINYTITYELNGGENNSSNVSSYNIETPTITFAEPEKYGYKFSGWYKGDNKVIELPKGSFGNITLTAKWEIDIESTCFTFDLADDYTITGIKEDENVDSILISDYVTEIDDYAFLTDSNIKTLTFAKDSKCKSIGLYAFQYCDSLAEIGLPKSIEIIESAAFYMCTSLKRVVIEDGSVLRTISGGAFSDCYVLESFEIPSTVKDIGEGAFSGCTALESITFKSGSVIESIGNFAFSYCENLKDIKIPASVNNLGEGVFMMCTSLESVAFEKGCTLESIPDNVFTACNSLRSVVIPKSVTNIGTFSSYSVDEVFYEGSLADSQNLNGLEEFLLSGTEIFFYSENQPGTEGNYWHFVDGEVVKWQ